MSDLLLLSKARMSRISPHFPLSHGASRVDDRRVVNGINQLENARRWYFATRWRYLCQLVISPPLRRCRRGSHARLILQRIECDAEGRRELTLGAMREVGLELLEAPDLGIARRYTPPPLAIDDESLVPDNFWVARPAWLDYQAIRNALKVGAQVTGAL